MTQEIQVTIEAIDDKSPHLQTVKALWRASSKTLGRFPKGAFAERAAHRQILVALAPQLGCIGYLLYRHSYDRITIVHLCIARSHQGQGVARLLIDQLKQITKEKYSGIGLHCRRDYGLEEMWSRLGFVAKYEKTGDSKDGKLLTYWWLDHGHQNLFFNVTVQRLESKLCVVIDAKVFFDICADEDNDSEESKSLLADWIRPELELCVTDELLNIINNTIDKDDDRKRYRKVAETFTRLSCRTQNLDTIVKGLQNLFSERGITLNKYDVRYIARTIASDSHIFVTTDEQLLNLASEVYEKFRLSIIRPNNLIIQLDELRRIPEYQPVRLAGTLLKRIPVQRGQEDFLTNYFQYDKQDETKAEFQQQLRRFLAEPEKFECSVVIEGENQPIALVVYGKQKKHELEIPMLRVGTNPLSATLARHLIFRSISRSAHDKRQFTRITDPYLDETVTRAIQEDAFIRVNNGWLKVNLAVAETASQLSLRLTNVCSSFGEEYNFCLQIAESLNRENMIRDVQASADIERFLFPAKIIDAEIPTFIIPIQPRWAKDLFDEKLANQTLFGAKTELAFNREAVFYRAVQNSRGLKAPCRVLWYVSGTQSEGKGKGYCEVESVRACSYLDEVVVGKPKELYQRFQRLGVYKFRDIENLNPNKDGNIMAIRFSDIELFENPVNSKQIQEICDKKLLLISPSKIKKEHFIKVYNLGIQNSSIS